MADFFYKTPIKLNFQYAVAANNNSDLIYAVDLDGNLFYIEKGKIVKAFYANNTSKTVKQILVIDTIVLVLYEDGRVVQYINTGFKHLHYDSLNISCMTRISSTVVAFISVTGKICIYDIIAEKYLSTMIAFIPFITTDIQSWYIPSSSFLVIYDKVNNLLHSFFLDKEKYTISRNSNCFSEAKFSQVAVNEEKGLLFCYNSVREEIIVYSGGSTEVKYVLEGINSLTKMIPFDDRLVHITENKDVFTFPYETLPKRFPTRFKRLDLVAVDDIIKTSKCLLLVSKIKGEVTTESLEKLEEPEKEEEKIILKEGLLKLFTMMADYEMIETVFKLRDHVLKVSRQTLLKCRDLYHLGVKELHVVERERGFIEIVSPKTEKRLKEDFRSEKFNVQFNDLICSQNDVYVLNKNNELIKII